jgi:hypothetical protein
MHNSKETPKASIYRPVTKGLLSTFSAFAFCTFYSVCYAASLPPSEEASTAPSPFTYADVADLASKAEIIVSVRPRSLVQLTPKAQANSADSQQRVYVEADPLTLIRGSATLPKRMSFVLDLPGGDEARKGFKNRPVILFGRFADDVSRLQLVSSKAMLPFSPATEAKVRGIVEELQRTDAPSAVTGIAEAFHVAGSVAGESETQVFLNTANGRPVSLSIIRRPDVAPAFGVALGEIVDEAASVPKRDTLLWYRLSCALPASLPDAAVAKLEAADASAAQGDYKAFLEQLGPCARTRAPILGNQPAPG